MAGRMIWHDTRLEGTAPPLAPNKHVVDDTSDLDGSINWIATYARSQGGLDELMIFCEGSYGNAGAAHGTTSPATNIVGGFGLRLCKQKLHLGNVSKLRAWNPGGARLIQRVTIYACGAAMTESGNEGTWGDGRRFMGEFAIHSGAYVVAAKELQTYEYATGWFSSPIDFGEWEGPVYLFDPATGHGTPFTPGAMA
jgi:hypothetical protein